MPIEKTTERLDAGVYVVATPIGNLTEISQRALTVLEQARIIVAEDTRRAQALFQALGLNIKTKDHHKEIHRLDEHAEFRMSDEMFNRYADEVKIGKIIAVVSDAGTPGISDPSAKFIREMRKRNVTIRGISGPSALTTFVSIAGFEKMGDVVFLGFFPRDLTTLMTRLNLTLSLLRTNKSIEAMTLIGFESPRRIRDTLKAIVECLKKDESENADRSHFQMIRVELLAVKELTKKFENHFAGSPDHVLDQVEMEMNRIGEIGEWVIGIHFSVLSTKVSSIDVSDHATNEIVETIDESHRSLIKYLLDKGWTTKDLTALLVDVFGYRKSKAYDFVLDLKKF